jgi:hypothetical protein
MDISLEDWSNVQVGRHSNPLPSFTIGLSVLDAMRPEGFGTITEIPAFAVSL